MIKTKCTTKDDNCAKVQKDPWACLTCDNLEEIPREEAERRQAKLDAEYKPPTREELIQLGFAVTSWERVQAYLIEKTQWDVNDLYDLENSLDNEAQGCCVKQAHWKKARYFVRVAIHALRAAQETLQAADPESIETYVCPQDEIDLWPDHSYSDWNDPEDENEDYEPWHLDPSVR